MHSGTGSFLFSHGSTDACRNSVSLMSFWPESNRFAKNLVVELGLRNVRNILLASSTASTICPGRRNAAAGGSAARDSQKNSNGGPDAGEPNARAAG
jgi:hypothetical protein